MSQIDTLVFWRSHEWSPQPHARAAAVQVAEQLHGSGCEGCAARIRRYPHDRRCTGVYAAGEMGTTMMIVAASIPRERGEQCRLTPLFVRTKES